MMKATHPSEPASCWGHPQGETTGNLCQSSIAFDTLFCAGLCLLYAVLRAAGVSPPTSIHDLGRMRG